MLVKSNSSTSITKLSAAQFRTMFSMDVVDSIHLMPKIYEMLFLSLDRRSQSHPLSVRSARSTLSHGTASHRLVQRRRFQIKG